MYKLIVGMGTCGISAGAKATYNKLSELLSKTPEKGELSITGCIGMCYSEPIIEVRENGIRTIYGHVDEKLAEKIYESHVLKDEEIKDHIIFQEKQDSETPTGNEVDYLEAQKRIVLRNCGEINPEEIKAYEDVDGYKGLKKALDTKPEEVIEEVKKSGMRGRGGGGFPTGLKWSFAAASKGEHKYVICNADEGDPGAFMDRSILEGDPHAVLEGMAICGYAIGADFGYIYCRAEYPLAIERLKKAIVQAKEKNILVKIFLERTLHLI